MARAQRQKLARESTAAYSASQPLFDVLRGGANKVGEQKFYLSQARDVVQNVHVKLVNATGNDDAEKHDQYVEHVVKAWRSATEVYSAIFEELASITAADPTEGREASKGHDEFMAMSANVEAAKKMAMSYSVAGTQPAATPSKSTTVEDVDSEEEEGEGKSEAEESTPVSGPTETAANAAPTITHPLALHGKRLLPSDESKKADQPPAKVQRLSENIRIDSQGKKVFWERGASQPNVPFGTLSATEQKAWRAEKARQKREKRKAKAKGVATAAGSDARPLGPNRHAKGYEQAATAVPTFGQDYVPLDAEPVSAGKENSVPGVVYEDVSAEVEARLKAKEERKAAKKDGRKRKRESAGSVLEVAPTDGVSEKPKKKKIKAETADGGKTDDAVAAKIEKRKKDVVDVEQAGEGRKKRKTSKT
ncbi:hypothetical protein LTR85_008742 [Meristemomyces frigidus]|nr:hypothetical protein LTR85_008742 [Meristemomyces frigidus]